MKAGRYKDTALMSLIGVLPVAGVLHSATGGEKTDVGLLALVLFVAVIIVGSRLASYRQHTHRPVFAVQVASFLALAIIISVAGTSWPLRASYILSRSSFDTVAQRIRNGEHVSTPLRAGLFKVERAELSRDGIVCLWIRPRAAGSTGFVQCRRDYVPFNLWSIVRLDDRWQFIAED